MLKKCSSLALLNSGALLSGVSLAGNCGKNSKRKQCEMQPKGSERKTRN